MKYFTPELLARFRSPDDHVSDKAHDDWDRAIDRYQRRLKKISRRLPTSVKRFRRQLCLHDAHIITLAQRGKQFFIVAELEPPSRTIVFLTVELIAKPKINHAPSLEPHALDYVTWMYEEFGLGRKKGCTLEIMLSDGSLMKLQFDAFRFSTGQQILPELNGRGVKRQTVVA
jgi:hypothetical protein